MTMSLGAIGQIALTVRDLPEAVAFYKDGLGLPQPYAGKVLSLRQLTGELSAEITMLSDVIADLLAGHRGYQAIQVLPGIGPVLAAVIVAEIGDISRFRRPEQLCCWAGLTPRHRESDTSVHRGPITKQGSKLVRWAAIEACQRTRPGSKLAADRTRIITARGRNIGVVAAARRLLTLVYYGLRDGEIRTLARGAG